MHWLWKFQRSSCQKRSQHPTNVQDPCESSAVNSSRPYPGRTEKIKLNLYFKILCGVSKGLKALRPS